jgi:hypothetical protein
MEHKFVIDVINYEMNAKDTFAELWNKFKRERDIIIKEEE